MHHRLMQGHVGNAAYGDVAKSLQRYTVSSATVDHHLVTRQKTWQTNTLQATLRGAHWGWRLAEPRHCCPGQGYRCRRNIVPYVGERPSDVTGCCLRYYPMKLVFRQIRWPMLRESQDSRIVTALDH